MRRTLVTTSLVVVLAFSAAACGADGSAPEPAATTPAAGASAAGGDVTAAACAEAITMSESSKKGIGDKMTEVRSLLGSSAVTPEAQDRAEQLVGELNSIADTWTAKMRELAAKDIDGDARTAFSESVEDVKELQSEDSKIGVGQIDAYLTSIVNRIKTACE